MASNRHQATAGTVAVAALVVGVFAQTSHAITQLPWTASSCVPDSFVSASLSQNEGDKPVAFPETRPRSASFARPEEGEVVEVSPPGFCWWRVEGANAYRLKVRDATGNPVYQSPTLEDPVHVPTRAFPPGSYTWIAEALDGDGVTLAKWGPRHFSIAGGCPEQPWVDPEELLARVPKEHPRLLFLKRDLSAIRQTLGATRREAFESLKRSADGALKLKPPPEPTYDQIEDRVKRRMGYVDSFRAMRRYHTRGMPSCALMYLLTGEREYGEVARAILVDAARWDPEGISSIMAPYGDEIGLGLVNAGAHTYDWIYDLLSDDERELVRKMLIARADQMLRRLQRRDYLYRPESSHDGRLPGYLIEHAIALAEEPRAKVWMDYAMRTVLTVFPHWAGRDGGWAEGISYAQGYNTIYLQPFEALRLATGFDMWQRPFYRKVRYFFFYTVSPVGEIKPFGDSEIHPMRGAESGMRALMLYHALRYRDPAVRWYVDQLGDPEQERRSISALPGLLLADDLAPAPPTHLPNDKAFFGVGIAALHSNILDPRDDLMILLKSSPYGAVSHSHADQNSFAIMKGGDALAIPAGYRHPAHGSAFHTKYTQHTIAHNAILVNGEGQINRDATANGHLTTFETMPHIGYACGDATAAYRNTLTRCRRHVVMIRPSVICVVDDLEAPRAAEYQWLLHAFEQFGLNEAEQQLVSTRAGNSMTVHLATPGGFAFEQTDEWPMDPNEGVPESHRKELKKHWHFTATTREKAATRRIAAFMTVEGDSDVLPVAQSSPADGVVQFRATFPDGTATVLVRLAPDAGPELMADREAILEARFEPERGEPEVLTAR